MLGLKERGGQRRGGRASESSVEGRARLERRGESARGRPWERARGARRAEQAGAPGGATCGAATTAASGPRGLQCLPARRARGARAPERAPPPRRRVPGRGWTPRVAPAPAGAPRGPARRSGPRHRWPRLQQMSDQSRRGRRGARAGQGGPIGGAREAVQQLCSGAARRPIKARARPVGQRWRTAPRAPPRVHLRAPAGRGARALPPSAGPARRCRAPAPPPAGCRWCSAARPRAWRWAGGGTGRSSGSQRRREQGERRRGLGPPWWRRPATQRWAGQRRACSTRDMGHGPVRRQQAGKGLWGYPAGQPRVLRTRERRICSSWRRRRGAGRPRLAWCGPWTPPAGVRAGPWGLWRCVQPCGGGKRGANLLETFCPSPSYSPRARSFAQTRPSSGALRTW